jgi:hypothetical protein
LLINLFTIAKIKAGPAPVDIKILGLCKINILNASKILKNDHKSLSECFMKIVLSERYFDKDIFLLIQNR